MKNKQPVPVLIPFLILVSMLFIGILIFAYVETKKANPKMIDQRWYEKAGPPAGYVKIPNRRTRSGVAKRRPAYEKE